MTIEKQKGRLAGFKAGDPAHAALASQSASGSTCKRGTYSTWLLGADTRTARCTGRADGG